MEGHDQGHREQALRPAPGNRARRRQAGCGSRRPEPGNEVSRSGFWTSRQLADPGSEPPGAVLAAALCAGDADTCATARSSASRIPSNEPAARDLTTAEAGAFRSAALFGKSNRVSLFQTSGPGWPGSRAPSFGVRSAGSGLSPRDTINATSCIRSGRPAPATGPGNSGRRCPQPCDPVLRAIARDLSVLTAGTGWALDARSAPGSGDRSQGTSGATARLISPCASGRARYPPPRAGDSAARRDGRPRTRERVLRAGSCPHRPHVFGGDTQAPSVPDPGARD